MLQLEWSPQAIHDLAEIQLYIEQRSPRAAVDLLATIKNGAEKLVFVPFAFRAGRIVGTREYLVHPNYIIVYKVGRDIVEILRVIHARREYP